jgi:hypothetical protein
VVRGRRCSSPVERCSLLGDRRERQIASGVRAPFFHPVRARRPQRRGRGAWASTRASPQKTKLRARRRSAVALDERNNMAKRLFRRRQQSGAPKYARRRDRDPNERRRFGVRQPVAIDDRKVLLEQVRIGHDTTPGRERRPARRSLGRGCVIVGCLSSCTSRPCFGWGSQDEAPGSPARALAGPCAR